MEIQIEPDRLKPAKRGRRPAHRSRSLDIYIVLLVWERTPEEGKMSLRTLAAKMCISHQLLSYCWRRLSRFTYEQYFNLAEKLILRGNVGDTEMARVCEDRASATLVRSRANELRAKVQAGAALSRAEMRLAKVCEEAERRIVNGFSGQIICRSAR